MCCPRCNRYKYVVLLQFSAAFPARSMLICSREVSRWQFSSDSLVDKSVAQLGTFSVFGACINAPTRGVHANLQSWPGRKSRDVDPNRDASR